MVTLLSSKGHCLQIWCMRIGTRNAQVHLKNQCWPIWCVQNKYVFRSWFFQTICGFSAYGCFEKQATDYQFSALNFVFFASVWPIHAPRLPHLFALAFVWNPWNVSVCSHHLCSAAWPHVAAGKKSRSVPREKPAGVSLILADIYQTAGKAVQPSQGVLEGQPCFREPLLN